MSTGFDSAIDNAISQIAAAAEVVTNSNVVRGALRILSTEHQVEIQYERAINNGVTEYQAKIISGLGAGATVYTAFAMDAALSAAFAGALAASPVNAPTIVLLYVGGLSSVASAAQTLGNGTTDMASYIVQTPIWNDIFNDAKNYGAMGIKYSFGTDVSLTGVDNFDARFNFNGTNYLDDLNGDYDADEVVVEEHETTTTDPITQQPVTQTHETTFTKPSATAAHEGKTYLIEDIFKSVQDAGDAVAKFISEQAGIGTEWYTSVNTQNVIATWLAENIEDILNGDMSADEALISLAQHAGETVLSNFVGASVVTALDANEALQEVFVELGAGEAFAAQYAAGVQAALGRLAFELVTTDFDVEQATNAAAATLAASITSTFVVEQKWFLENSPGQAASAAAAATAIIGIINSGDFDSGDWAQLGLQIGVAAGAGYAGAAIGAAYGAAPLPIIGVDPVTIVATAVISLFAGKIIGKLFGSAKFGAGEFDSVTALFNSIYQVQTINVGGVDVPALVAVNAAGSTILASGSGIGYILGNIGSDVLVGDANVQTITAGDGADYLEAQGGADNLLGGNGNDHLNGGDGGDVLQGDAGEDILFGEDGDDTALGGNGNDFMHLGGGDDIAAGGDGNDYILAAGGDDAISGDAGNDTLDGGYGDDSIDAGAGNDLVLGNLGNDYIDGGDGSDTLFGDVGNDQIYGGLMLHSWNAGTCARYTSGDNGAALRAANDNWPLLTKEAV